MVLWIWQDIILALVGGLLIGLSTTLNLYWYGRITGMSGIFNTLIKVDKEAGFQWKFSFFAGLIFIPSLIFYIVGSKDKNMVFFDAGFNNINVVGLLIAGILVGIGTRMGNGCTSGHAVCGMPRLSKRSIFATMTFMSSGIAMATLRYYVPFFQSQMSFGNKFPEVWRIISIVLF